MLNLLFVGGTGQISLCCVEAALAAGHRVTIYNRGQTPAGRYITMTRRARP